MPAHRRPDPKKFLDAGLAPLESALLHRAGEIEARCGEITEEEQRVVLAGIAEEFRQLAAELHHH